jgi:hypothetical protein
LAIVDWESGELTGTNINNVIYHDVCNIVDFLVLRQVYDKAMRHRWSVGDRLAAFKLFIRFKFKFLMNALYLDSDA